MCQGQFYMTFYQDCNLKIQDLVPLGRSLKYRPLPSLWNVSFLGILNVFILTSVNFILYPRVEIIEGYYNRVQAGVQIQVGFHEFL